MEIFPQLSSAVLPIAKKLSFTQHAYGLNKGHYRLQVLLHSHHYGNSTFYFARYGIPRNDMESGRFIIF